MTVKTGQAWAGLFVTLDATGAASAADSTPTGTLYINGVADAASVTITGSNPYKFAVTLPTLTAGQRVDMYITATIDSVATAGIVASAQADTRLLSDGVTLADDAITAAKFDESTAYPLKSADTGATQVARVGADSDTLETLSDQLDAAATASALSTLDGKVDTIDNFLDTEVAAILEDTGTTIPATLATLATAAALDAVDNYIDTEVAAIKAKTDLIPAAPAEAGEYTAAIAAIQDDLDNPDQYKADVSALATSADLATVDTNVDSVLADTNEIQAELADGGRTDSLIDSIVDATTATGVLLKDAAIEAIFNDVVVTGTYTFAQLMKIMAAKIAGKATGGGTTTITYRGVDDTSNVIVETVDANGNRSAVTLTV